MSDERFEISLENGEQVLVALLGALRKTRPNQQIDLRFDQVKDSKDGDGVRCCCTLFYDRINLIRITDSITNPTEEQLEKVRKEAMYSILTSLLYRGMEYSHHGVLEHLAQNGNGYDASLLTFVPTVSRNIVHYYFCS